MRMKSQSGARKRSLTPSWLLLNLTSIVVVLLSMLLLLLLDGGVVSSGVACSDANEEDVLDDL